MIRGLRVIEGLGGTGKTHAILDAAREIARDGDDSLYLCFNRPLRESTRGKLSGSRTEALHDPRIRVPRAGRAGTPPSGAGRGRGRGRDLEEESLREAAGSVPYNLRRRRRHAPGQAQAIPARLHRRVPESRRRPAADGQRHRYPPRRGAPPDGRSPAGRLRLPREAYGSRPSNFERIKEIFGRAPDAKVQLTENRRSAPAIVSFIDGYLERAFKGKSILRYKRTDDSLTESTEDRPRIEIFGQAKDEAAYVIASIRKIREADKGASIAILSRYDRDLEAYRRAKIEGPRVAISTIHSSIGREAEHVFLVAFQDPISQKNDPREEHEERCIAYTALIRARKSLTVSTSYPNLAPERWFDPDTCEIAVRDIERSRPYGRFPKIRGNANYSRRKYDLASIDSISLRIPFEAVPFFPYIERAQGKRSKGKYDQNKGDNTSSFMKREVRNYQGVQVAISYHTSHRYYEFTLSDTNLLHRSGFTDVHVIKFLTNYILEYFDGRVGIDDIIISRIDIYKLLDGTREIEKLVAGADWVQKGKVIACRGKDSWREFRGEAELGRVLRRGSIYVNLSSVRARGITLAMYKPSLKVNENKIYDRNLVKAELRLKGGSLRRRYALGVISVKSFLEELREDEELLRTMADRVLEAKGARMSKSGGCFMGKKDEDGVEGEDIGAKKSIGEQEKGEDA